MLFSEDFESVLKIEPSNKLATTELERLDKVNVTDLIIVCKHLAVCKKALGQGLNLL